MDRASRQKKASLVQQAIQAMQNDLKIASEARKADLFEDISMAQGDYDALMDFDKYPDEYFDDTMFDADLSLEGPGDVLAPSPMDEVGLDPLGVGNTEIDPLGGFPGGFPGDDSVIESMDSCGGCGGGPTEANLDMTSEDMWTATNRDHVSYILDRVADLTASIEQYEHRAALQNKQAKSKGARATVASHMKKLASTLHKADLASPETGKALDEIGVGVMALHKQFGLS